ncbi:lysophospholipid acyltransferase family protein [Jannaschia sp. 2305UL9-9]|uniref:lysophospholipid acyltransferase family protein n=1 Tax=Jannaschia sp. 2305UL9-9 TaxID=3121638 RepID=UPI003527532A
MQLIRSLVFNVTMYVWMAVIGIVFAPWAIMSPDGARRACDIYARHTLWLLRVLTGLRTEVRGTPPTEAALVAAKHQSFLDILMIWVAMPRGFFVMKAILRFAPFLGAYALRLGCIPVHRGKRAEAVRMMLSEVRSGKRAGGQLLIYPQGTRVAPGVVAPYKIGTYALYEQLGQPCYPVATNVGVFWPKRGLLRKPGLGVVEFLDPIPPGLDRATFMALLNEKVETASNRLMAEAGFPIAETAPKPALPEVPDPVIKG